MEKGTLGELWHSEEGKGFDMPLSEEKRGEPLDNDCFNQWNREFLIMYAMRGDDVERMNEQIRVPLKKYFEFVGKEDSADKNLVKQHDQLVDLYNKSINNGELDYKYLLDLIVRAAALFNKDDDIQVSIKSMEAA